jgi:S-adenosylmethionine decarboxylase
MYDEGAQVNLTPSSLASVGKHVLICVKNICNSKVLETVDHVIPLLDAIVKTCDLHVVAKVHHQFTPIGATCVYVLEESHMSIHTYPENSACYMDIFCCSHAFEPEKAILVIQEWFDKADIQWSTFVR